jgi:HD-GYP domain-containing protein (c-di-GMP phosphodiesterase class II)
VSTVAQREPAGKDGLNADACPEAADLLGAGRHHRNTRGLDEKGPSKAGGRQLAPSLRQLAQVSLATLLVAGLPVAAVWWMRASGMVSSPAVGVGLGMGLSIAVSRVACLVWESHTGTEDLLFSELMIWGYLHRWRMQRRLASARELLGPISETHPSAVNRLGAKDPVTLLERLVARMETRDPYLHNHSRRVARHSWMIARRMGLSGAQVARIRTAAAIHDVGKINTPTTILHKTGPLTDEEYDVIKRHPGDGARMVAVLHDPELTAIVRGHHERLDGTGYPDGLLGEEIPVGARVIAVADTFDAITSVRPYRSARTHKQAIEILKEEAGTKLDPLAVRAFCSHYAGRHPLVLFSTVAGVPERVLSWLGESVAGVASMAKVVAVAALVGGAAATSSTLAVPLAKHERANSGPARALGLEAAHSSRVGGLPGARPAKPAARNAESPPAAAARAGLKNASQIPVAAQSRAQGTSGQPAQTAGVAAGSAQLTGPGGNSEHALGNGRRERPAVKSRPPVAPGKLKPERAPVKGGAPEASRKGRPEAAPVKANPTGPPVKGRAEEAKSTVRPEQASGTERPEQSAGARKPEEAPGAGKGAPTAGEAPRSAAAPGSGH